VSNLKIAIILGSMRPGRRTGGAEYVRDLGVAEVVFA
jgi:hypothetical protein